VIVLVVFALSLLVVLLLRPRKDALEEEGQRNDHFGVIYVWSRKGDLEEGQLYVPPYMATGMPIEVELNLAATGQQQAADEENSGGIEEPCEEIRFVVGRPAFDFGEDAFVCAALQGW